MKKNKTTHAMAGVLMVIFIMAFLIVAGRFLYIQASGVVEGVSLDEWATKVRTTSYTLDSERGKIYDKNGMTLAYDMPTFRMYAIVDERFSVNLKEKQHVVDPVETAEKLAPLLNAEKDYILERLNYGIEDVKITQVEFGAIGKEISLQTKDDIQALELPGIRFIQENIRYYPNGMFASHIIGFARETGIETKDGTVTEITGVTGIENEMNDLLKGVDGKISYQRDIYNKKLLDPSEVIQMPDNGDDVYLTIDQKIQTLVEDVMTQVEEKYNPERMTAIVMNPKTGEIVAMSNRPSYNPNNPANVQNWYNDAISTPFEPGSTVKMFTWAAAIESKVYNGDEGYMSGKYQISDRISPIHDFNRKGWGTISYDEGFARSSNVAAAKLVWEKMGPDTFLEYLKAFDIDKPTGIDLPGEVQGQILYNWPLEKITTSFGQGSTATPIQLMKAATAIANDGKMLKPYIIDRIVDPDTGSVIENHEPEVVGEPISKETAEQVRELLVSAVQSEHAVGSRFNLDDYSIGGKTGTAQIPDPNGGYLTGRENYVFSFLGMAPADDPELMMYVSVKQPTLEFEAGIEAGSAPVSFIFNNVMENALHYLSIDPDKGSVGDVNVYEIPNLVGKSVASLTDSLSEAGVNYTVIGSGTRIVQLSAEVGTKILPNEKVLILTDSPTMPNIIGWSLRDVLKLGGMLSLDIEIFGNGYVVTQSIEEGQNIGKGTYLGIELKTPKELQEMKATKETSDEEEATEEDEPVDVFE